VVNVGDDGEIPDMVHEKIGYEKGARASALAITSTIRHFTGFGGAPACGLTPRIDR